MKNQNALSLIILFALACSQDTEPSPDFDTANVEVLATGFDIPWGIEVIDEEDLIFTERLGRLYHYTAGDVRQIEPVPGTVTVPFDGLIYGGFMDVSLHPSFATNKLVYLAYVAPDYKLTVARFTLIENQARNFEIVFRSNAFSIGSRIAWQDEEHFFLTQGLGGNPTPEPGPQNLRSDGGKIHRLNADGTIPADNPIFLGNPDPTSIWSYGHRDPQGIFVERSSGSVFSHEHGPLGGDEFNEIEQGGNYGWPLFSYGMNYDRTPVSTMTQTEAEETTVLPLHHFEPTIAPSGLLKLTASNFLPWNGKFLMGSLAQQNLVAYDPTSNRSEILIRQIGRVRDVAMTPSGNILLLIDKGSPRSSDPGRILELSPK